ncbi:hypothetical protein Q757_08870 [Oenococcus alcoholitolerans]|uniref:Uncharacterized protein n=1 Tax=Oenococcus alcoholitolerans TaxID=931074 RepID=A0ABR4XP19_9LACO|nr:hypothetical protein Q757_08870 [Oenococcus alcoholitolerans]
MRVGFREKPVGARLVQLGIKECSRFLIKNNKQRHIKHCVKLGGTASLIAPAFPRAFIFGGK